MKPARLLDDALYGDYPALYALGVETPVRIPRRQRGWILMIGALSAVLLSSGIAVALIVR
jgi:hypothetical protein